jgi:hypothetical protein
MMKQIENSSAYRVVIMSFPDATMEDGSGMKEKTEYKYEGTPDDHYS